MEIVKQLRTRPAKRVAALEEDVKNFNLIMPLVRGQRRGRMLLLLDWVPTEDIRSGRLLDGEAGTVMNNIYRFAEFKWPEILCANWCDYKVNTLDEAATQAAYRAFWARAEYLIEQYNPDIVVFSGFEAARFVVKNRKSEYDMGRIHTAHFAGARRKYLITVGLSDVSTSNPERLKSTPNLIGLLYRHLELAVYGKNRYTIRTKGVTNTTISTMKSFHKAMRELRSARVVAFDTEGKNLNKRWGNQLYCLQWTCNGKDAYFLPLYHRETPWTTNQLEEIRATLQRYFEFEGPEGNLPPDKAYKLAGKPGRGRYHIWQNAKYDVLQAFAVLKVRWYSHLVYDTQAGQFGLDENAKFMFETYRVGTYGLELLTRLYGSRMYDTGAISKEDRANMEQFSLQQIAEYGFKDVVGPWQIAQFQQAEAHRRGPAYEGYFNSTVHQIGTMILDFAEMESNGLNIDRPYLVEQLRPDSQLVAALSEVNGLFKRSRAARKTNELLLQARGKPSKSFGLFRKAPQPEAWVFNINQEATKQILFKEVLGLKGELNKKKGLKLGKFFKKAYADVLEVKLLDRYEKNKKLKSTYVEGILKKLATSADAAVDGRLRPYFKYLNIITGRAGAEDPSFHQIPSRGDLAKIIKRQFIVSGPGFIILKVDYSAHEVRIWGIVSNDSLLCKTFRIGLNLRRNLRLLAARRPKAYAAWQRYKKSCGWNDKDEKKRPLHDAASKARLLSGCNNPHAAAIGAIDFELESKGDIHRLNCEFFYGTPAAEVTDEVRGGVKQVVFGVIYGKGAKALAEDIKATVEAAEALMSLMFKKFVNGGKWLKHSVRQARDSVMLTGLTHRVRHLWGHLHHAKSVHAAMDRRGPNSLIQGPSSDMGFQGGREISRLIWYWVRRHGLPFSHAPENKVHDSNTSEVHVIDLPLALYFTEHGLTTQVHNKMQRVFGFDFLVDLECEFELGARSEADLVKWSFVWDDLSDIVESQFALAEQTWGRRYGVAAQAENLQLFRQNLQIVAELRTRELQRVDQARGVAREMLITDKIIRQLHTSSASIFDEVLRKQRRRAR